MPRDDPAYGCLTGDDEADLYGTAIDPKYVGAGAHRTPRTSSVSTRILGKIMRDAVRNLDESRRGRTEDKTSLCHDIMASV